MYSKTELPLSKKAIGGWLLVIALIGLQLISVLTPGDEKITLEGNQYGMYMFEANHQCVWNAVYYLADGTTELSFSSPQTTGGRGGEWCAFGADGEMPRDQRPDDGGSLQFDSDPLGDRLEILGAPVLELDLACDQPVAMIAARLCDVAPDGTSLRVSYGLLNLSHRESHEFPEPLEPGSRYRVRLQLNDCAHVFAAGSRIRVAVAPGLWPLVWPSPEPVTLTVYAGASSFDLPVRGSAGGDSGNVPLPPAEMSRVQPQTVLRVADPAV